MRSEEIRQRAAIAVLPECVRETHEVLSNGDKFIEETQAKQAAMMAVAYADALAEKLKVDEQETESKFNAEKIVKVLKEQVGFDPEIHKIIDEHFDEMLVEEPVNLSNLERTGKNWKPANFSKSSKDLQELTEFEKEFAKWYDSVTTGYPTPMTKEELRAEAKHVLDIAYKQFERTQLNQKLEEYEQLFQRFNDAVNEEIKKRCDGIDVDEMARIFFLSHKGSGFSDREIIHEFAVCSREAYKKGVLATIKKLKEE
jgi:hypothetical protein